MAGFLGMGGYSKPGKGIEKGGPQKRGPFLFFEIYIRKFWRLMTLNLTYVLALIPTFIIMFFLTSAISNNVLSSEHVSKVIMSAFGTQSMDVNNLDMARIIVTLDIIIKSIISLMFTILWGMGPATAGFAYVLRNFAREEHAWVWSDFWENTFKNFKQASVVWLIDILALFSIYYAYMFYGNLEGSLSLLKYVIVAFSIIYTIMHFYIYQMMTTFELSLKNIYRNALIFAFARLPLNFIILALVLLVSVAIIYLCYASGAFVLLYLILFLIAELVMLLSFTGFIVSFGTYPTIKKYMLIESDVKVKKS